MTYTPSITMDSVLAAIKSELQAQAASDVHVEIAPGGILPVQYEKYRYQIEPVTVRRVDTGAGDRTDHVIRPEIAVRVWVTTALVGGDDGSLEYIIMGDGTDPGLADALETAESILQNYFLADANVRLVKIDFDEPTFGPVYLADNNIAYAGSFILTVQGTMGSSPTTPMMFSRRVMATPPLVSNVQTEVLGSESVRVTWTTNFASTSYVEYGLTGGALSSQSAEDTSETTSHSVTITGLDPDTSYDFKPCSKDLASNLTGKAHARSTAATDPAPVTFEVTGVSFSVTKNSITVDYETTTDCKCTISHRPDSGFALWQAEEFNTAHASPHSHTVDGFNEGTIYRVRVRAYTVGGDEDFDPSETGYHLVQTATDTDPGGYIETV